MRPILLDTRHAAERCFVAKSTIRSWVRKGWLVEAGRHGGKCYYLLDDLLKAERRARRGADVADPS